MILVGTCGFGRSRARTFQELQAVEIQETFYRPVTSERARAWREGAPARFVFAVKASQFITHEASSPTYRRAGRTIPVGDAPTYGAFQDTAFVREGWEATRAVAEALDAKALVFQTPASFGPTPGHIASLYRFFESVRSDAVLAWEPRGPWPTHVVEKACEDLHLVHAVDPFAAEPATYGLAYFRLHGKPPGRSMYRYTYTAGDLATLRATCEEYDDAYAMFNNVTMHDDARRFRDVLAAAGTRESTSSARSGEERFL